MITLTSTTNESGIESGTSDERIRRSHGYDTEIGPLTCGYKLHRRPITSLYRCQLSHS